VESFEIYGWRRMEKVFGPIMLQMRKYYTQSRRRGISYI
jgi:hypothetical protein